jgi:hypothetical protein
MNAPDQSRKRVKENNESKAAIVYNASWLPISQTITDDLAQVHIFAETLWLRARFEAANAALKKVVCLLFISAGCPWGPIRKNGSALGGDSFWISK